jgi:hypothetical protein
MKYLVSVITDGTELATPGEMAAIDAFNDRLTRAATSWSSHLDRPTRDCALRPAGRTGQIQSAAELSPGRAPLGAGLPPNRRPGAAAARRS